jgi:hypothetical protein
MALAVFGITRQLDGMFPALLLLVSTVVGILTYGFLAFLFQHDRLRLLASMLRPQGGHLPAADAQGAER